GYGRAVTGFGSATSVRKLVLGSNNSILVVGSAGGNFAMVRFTRTGALDSTFGGTTGKVLTNFGGSDGAATAMYTADGQILAAGGTDGDFAIARYNYNG